MKQILTLITILTLIGVAQAHAPSEVDVRLTNDTLILAVVHKSKKMSKHYIDKITVKVNGDVVLVKQYTGQNSIGGHNVDIALPQSVTGGDIISVTAHCNKKGEATGELKVPEEELTLDVEEIKEEVLDESVKKAALDKQLVPTEEEITTEE